MASMKKSIEDGQFPGEVQVTKTDPIKIIVSKSYIQDTVSKYHFPGKGTRAP